MAAQGSEVKVIMAFGLDCSLTPKVPGRSEQKEGRNVGS